MNKKSGLSLIGYAIVVVILIGLGMIFSAPVLFDKYNHSEPVNYSSPNNNMELRDIESRISRLEGDTSDKYVCTIEGGLSEDGIVIPIDPNNPPRKFIFSCEYKK